ncbi:hypothetical protein BIV18_09315 [Peptoniphilus porci]|uniref:Uncharacterized protein n=1 Tax=Peptoniphilus porci TaxID=2652280 RepID=A0A1U7M218_9FIRM|nr:hypothetical protein BIV18_09315 [Peptoniphilus porci]
MTSSIRTLKGLEEVNFLLNLRNIFLPYENYVKLLTKVKVSNIMIKEYELTNQFNLYYIFGGIK